MTQALLTVDDLRKVFPGRRGHADVVAVDGVSFELAPGESLAIVGESGSGKTTVARMLVGLERPTSGSIKFRDTAIDASRRGAKDRRERARQIQMVFQDPYSSLDKLQTIQDILDDALSLNPSSRTRDRGNEILELLRSVGLQERHAQARPGGLSGGQRQRVAIARALAARPDVVVLDEAVAALDVSIQAQVLNLLKDIRERTGTAYVFISHDLAVVNQVSERCIVMRQGRVVEEGTTAQVLHTPRDPYTQRLRDAVPRPGWKPSRAAEGAAVD